MQRQSLGLWQPWNDHPSPAPVTDGASTSLQTALENLRCLSVLQSSASSTQHQGISSSHHQLAAAAAAAAVTTTSTTANVTPYIAHRATSSGPAATGNHNIDILVF